MNVIENIEVKVAQSLTLGKYVFKLEDKRITNEISLYYRCGKMKIRLWSGEISPRPSWSISFDYMDLHLFDLSFDYLFEDFIYFIRRATKKEVLHRDKNVLLECYHLTQFKYWWAPKRKNSCEYWRGRYRKLPEARYKTFNKNQYAKYLTNLSEKHKLRPDEIKFLTLRSEEKLPEDLFATRLFKKAKVHNIKVKRQVSVTHKDKTYRVDFFLTKGKKAIVIEHDGEYHDIPSIKLKDELRDSRITAALLYDYYEGVKIYRVGIGSKEVSFLADFESHVVEFFDEY